MGATLQGFVEEIKGDCLWCAPLYAGPASVYGGTTSFYGDTASVYGGTACMDGGDADLFLAELLVFMAEALAFMVAVLVFMVEALALMAAVLVFPAATLSFLRGCAGCVWPRGSRGASRPWTQARCASVFGYSAAIYTRKSAVNVGNSPIYGGSADAETTCGAGLGRGAGPCGLVQGGPGEAICYRSTRDLPRS